MKKSIEKTEKTRAPQNRTLRLESDEVDVLKTNIIYADLKKKISVENSIICGDTFTVLPGLPSASFDLLFADPPYNLTKLFGKEKFKRTSENDYEEWLDSWLKLCVPLLKPNASIYICGDWRSSSAIQRVGSKYFIPRNRITWEREKGRGAKHNWKNSSEDIWYFTVSDEYTFNLDDVKQRRRVIAPYKIDGKPKNWDQTDSGNFRDTHPSNLWTDLTVPFWSMSENTDHPTQKPEKLLAKIILASTNKGGNILDPFAGSGTAAAAAKKLGRNYTIVESDETYCLIAAKRVDLAGSDSNIQGFADGIFWERNSEPKFFSSKTKKAVR